MDNLTRHLRSIALGCIVGVLACSLPRLVREGTVELWAAFCLSLLCCTPPFVLSWRMRGFESGPTTRPTTATLLRTKGWRSVGSKTACKPSASPAPESSTTASSRPKRGRSGTPPDLRGWTWCPTKRQWSRPGVVLSEAAFAAQYPAALAHLQTGWEMTECGVRTCGCSGEFSPRSRARRQHVTLLPTSCPGPCSPR